MKYIYIINVNMADYKLDKTAFKLQTFEQADKANIFEEGVSYGERLQQAWFLILQAYGYSVSNQPRLDRRCFSSRKMDC